MKPIIELQGLSKLYELGVFGATTLREAFERWREGARRGAALTRAGAEISGAHPRAGPRPDTFWAIKDLSFQVERGDILGVIGRNGSGKSTMLKVLARITDPTEGRAVIRGRVASLLEVGTGFHPDLTGRENVFMNGAILGMRKAEIARRFDEIIAFAEVERFVDTPVKRYSSGMYMRLAFAVAAHLDPDILLVDEVLAVGDAAFQRKCLGKMGSVAQQGRTVLFVSHNMAALANFCNKGALLDQGRLAAFGAMSEVSARYLGSLQEAVPDDLCAHRDRRGRGAVRFTRVSFEDGSGRPQAQGVSGEPLAIRLEYRSRDGHPLQNCRVSVALYDGAGQVLFNCSSELTRSEAVTLPAEGAVRCLIPRLPLSAGQYLVSPFLEVNREVEDWVEGGARLEVIDGDFYGTGRLYPEGWRGKGVLIEHRWLL